MSVSQLGICAHCGRPGSDHVRQDLTQCMQCNYTFIACQGESLVQEPMSYGPKRWVVLCHPCRCGPEFYPENITASMFGADAIVRGPFYDPSMEAAAKQSYTRVLDGVTRHPYAMHTTVAGPPIPDPPYPSEAVPTPEAMAVMAFMTEAAPPEPEAEPQAEPEATPEAAPEAEPTQVTARIRDGQVHFEDATGKKYRSRVEKWHEVVTNRGSYFIFTTVHGQKFWTWKLGPDDGGSSSGGSGHHRHSSGSGHSGHSGHSGRSKEHTKSHRKSR